jgi:protein gp37
MHKTKIDWCDYTWNPVWGCLNTCSYCYARAIAHRFKMSFEPHWMPENYTSPMPKRPSRIFVNSMSDIAFWDDDWMRKVLHKIVNYPEHTFLFLTKFPQAYKKWQWPKNCWIGATATTENEVCTYLDNLLHADAAVCFLSIEPMMERIDSSLLCSPYLDWIIVGAETGNRKNRVIPERKWIEELKASGVPLFMKESLGDIMGWNLVRRWPEITP